MPPGATLTADTPWLVPEDPPTPVEKAIADVRDDWYRVFGRRSLVRSTPAAVESADVAIRIAHPDDRGERPLVDTPTGRKSFRIAIEADDEGRYLAVVGADVRGTVYAMYALSEWILGVDPLYHWTGHEPPTRETITLSGSFDRSAGPPTFRYRGWFINDEDVLHGDRPDPLSENVFSIDTWDAVYETLLRTRGNTVVPGTFTFPDETCRELAVDRGLVINDHHVCPLGLVTFEWPDDVAYSWQEHPEELLGRWERTVEEQCDREVLWTVGYRGKNDQPFWVDTPDAPETDEERAAIIQDVVEAQVALIREYDPDPDVVCVMFHELGEFYRRGLLSFPDVVVPVWDDDAAGIVQDCGSAAAGDGVYYHLAHGLTNRATEAIHPETMARELGRLVDVEATEFCLVNVSNVRYLARGIDAMMRFSWDGATLSADPATRGRDALRAWARRQYGEDQSDSVVSVVDRFQRWPHFAPTDEDGLPALTAFRGFTALNPILPDWMVLNCIRQLCVECRRLLPDVDPAPDHLRVDESGRVMFDDYRCDVDPEAATVRALEDLEHLLARDPDRDATIADARSVRNRVPSDRRPFYDANLLAPMVYLERATDALTSLGTAYRSLRTDDRSAATTAVGTALSMLEDGFDARHRADQGSYRTWSAHDVKSGCWHTRDHLRCLLAVLREEPEPPVRRFQDANNVWEATYAYHERGRPNYPLYYDNSCWE